jgi:ketosteroid isomerase-like protein
MKRLFLLALGYALMISCNSKEPAEQQPAAAATDAKPQPAEFADAKYTEIGKAELAAMQSGDVDKWLSMFADNAKYFWNSGDSLVGKAAISDYWKKRRTEVIDSISFMNDIWLPVKVNEPQRQVQSPGVWLLGWYQINAKYKTGKSMQQWTHVDFHFDANDKVDQVIQYLDKVPINAAMTK